MSTDPRCQNPECPVPENERPRGACRIPNFRNRKRGSTACTAFVPAEPAGQPTAEDCDRYRADVGLPLPAPEQGCEHEPELLHIKEVARSYGYAVLPADVVGAVRALVEKAQRLAEAVTAETVRTFCRSDGTPLFEACYSCGGQWEPGAKPDHKDGCEKRALVLPVLELTDGLTALLAALPKEGSDAR